MQHTDRRETRIITLLEWYKCHSMRGGKIFKKYRDLKSYVQKHESYLRQRGVLIPERRGHCTMVTANFGAAVFEHLFGN